MFMSSHEKDVIGVSQVQERLLGTGVEKVVFQVCCKDVGKLWGLANAHGRATDLKIPLQLTLESSSLDKGTAVH